MALSESPKSLAEQPNGTRLNALLHDEGPPSLLNNADHSDSLLLCSETTSESVSSDDFELDSDIFVFGFSLPRRHRTRRHRRHSHGMSYDALRRYGAGP